MKIIETEIPDIDIKDIDKTKINLAEKIIHNISPLFNELIQEKTDQIETKVNEFKRMKKNIVSNKNEIENLFKHYKKKQKIKKLLERIDKLDSLGIINQGHLKQETIILLKIVDKLSDEKLDYHLKETLNYISKRFSNN